MGRSEARECELRLSRAIRTADELRRTKTNDLIPLIVDIAREALSTMKPLKSGN